MDRRPGKQGPESCGALSWLTAGREQSQGQAPRRPPDCCRESLNRSHPEPAALGTPQGLFLLPLQALKRLLSLPPGGFPDTLQGRPARLRRQPLPSRLQRPPAPSFRRRAAPGETAEPPTGQGTGPPRTRRPDQPRAAKARGPRGAHLLAPSRSGPSACYFLHAGSQPRPSLSLGFLGNVV